MKKLAYVFVFVVLAMSAFAQTSEVSASVLKYEPTPAEQGSTVDVWIQLSNEGTKARNVALRLLPEYPFSVPAGQVEEVSVGTIAATEDKVVKYSVFIDPAAPNGDRTITFWYRYDSDNWIEFDAPVTLQTQNAVLVIDDYSVEPSEVVPGQQFTVKMRLKNEGTIDIKNTDVVLGLDDDFSTIGSGTKKRVPFIRAGQSADVEFMLASKTSTSVDLYQVPVSLEYQDTRNQEYNDSIKVSVRVNDEPDLSLHVDRTDFAKKVGVGTVSLKVVNKGLVDTKYVNIKLVGSEEYDVLSPSNEEYVGNLDNDDFETVDFIVKTKKKDPVLNAIIEFKDPYNQDYEAQYRLPLRIVTDKELGKGGSPVGIVILLLVVAGGIWYWRRKKRKKRR